MGLVILPNNIRHWKDYVSYCNTRLKDGLGNITYNIGHWKGYTSANVTLG